MFSRAYLLLLPVAILAIWVGWIANPNAQAHHEEGHRKDAAGDRESAIEHYQRALAEAPTSEDARGES